MIYWYELKKLLQTPALIGFFLLCLTLNVVLITTSYKAHVDHGRADITEMNDIFDGFATSILSEHYIAKLDITGAHAENVRKKYEQLQTVVDEKGRADESLSPYFGTETRYMHQLLFQRLFGAMTLESGLLALFVALLSTGYEYNQNTENIVYASKIGRKVQRKKFFAVLTMAAGCFLCLLGTTLCFYFLRFDYSHVWHDFVSSGFNASLSDYAKPLITWKSFTVLQLVSAYCGLSAGLTACFAWLGFAIGTVTRTGLRAAAASVGMGVFLFVIEPILPYGSQMRNLANLTPIRLLMNIGDWFTDGYANIVWCHFESIGILLSLAALAAAVVLALAYFSRRDML